MDKLNRAFPARDHLPLDRRVRWTGRRVKQGATELAQLLPRRKPKQGL